MDLMLRMTHPALDSSDSARLGLDLVALRRPPSPLRDADTSVSRDVSVGVVVEGFDVVPVALRLALIELYGEAPWSRFNHFQRIFHPTSPLS